MANLIQTDNSPADFCDKLQAKLILPASIMTFSAEDTFALGLKISSLLEKGSIVALNGVLGAGKTIIAKGIAKGLSIKEEIVSPTYTIVAEYQGFLPQSEPVTVYHIDAYRLNSDEDFLAIGGDELVYGHGISLIEWSERIASFIGHDTLIIDIKIADAEKRQITLYKTGG